MLSEASSRPRRGDDWLETILIGGIFLTFYVQVAVYYPHWAVRRRSVRGEAPTRWSTDSSLDSGVPSDRRPGPNVEGLEGRDDWAPVSG